MTIYYIEVEECSIFSFQEFHPKIGNLVHEILLLPDLNIGPLNNKADGTGRDSSRNTNIQFCWYTTIFHWL